MNNEITFSDGLKQYIKLALQVWPGLQISLRHLEDAITPTKDSYLPARNYKNMTNEEFIETVASDMHSYIMDHDVKAQHLEDYLDQILAIFNAEEENPNTIRFMSRQLQAYIYDLQEFNYGRLFDMRQLWEQVKKMPIQHQDDNSSESGSQGSEEDEEREEDIEIEEIEQKNIQNDVPQLTVEEKQELEDDGWNFVAPKKNRRK